MSQRPVLEIRPRVLAIREVRGGALPSQTFPKPRRPTGYRRDTLDEWKDALDDVPSASSDSEDSDHEADEVEDARSSERNVEDEYLGEGTPLAPSSVSRSDSSCSLFRSPSDAVAEDIVELAPPSPIVG